MPGAKARKQSKGKSRNRRFAWWGAIVALLIAAGVAIFVLVYPSSNSHELKAAIVDQLYPTRPNPVFAAEVTQELENYGFKVDIYEGNITVDFYRNLPAHEYDLIIFRTHSGVIGSSSEDVETAIGTYLFTNELYDWRKYREEQLNDELAIAKVTESSPEVFAIGPKFITNRMMGNFDNTVIIIAGCSCLYEKDLSLAEAFVDKGASVYLAWDRTVGLDYVDNAAIKLMQHLCATEPVAQAVSQTNLEVGQDPEYNALLRYYPAQNGDRMLNQLIKLGLRPLTAVISDW
jgi:hypothetical protein